MTTATLDSAPAIADLVRDSTRTHLPIVDYGAAHGDLGHPPPAEHVKLSQSGGVIEHYTRDLTVRVAAGMKLCDLQAALAETNQFLPLDADDDVTVGEAVVHNVYGPLRLTYGGPRDLLLGLHYVDGAARDIHVGGRTVKNVAGYDMTRFMVGSLGQLGVVYELTTRTYAIPEQVLAVQVRIEDPGDIDDLLSGWLLTQAAPTWIQLQYADQTWRLSMGYYGNAQAAAVQLTALKQLLAECDDMELIDAGTCELNDDLAERRLHRTWRRRAPAAVKIVVPPARTGATCRLIAKASPALTIDAMPTHGCIFAGGELDAAAAVGLDLHLMDQLHDDGGLRVWYRRPKDAERIKPFGPPQPDWTMLNRLQRTLDPHQLFNPGRFLPMESDAS